MNKILLRQATITIGYKFYATGLGNSDSYTLNSTSSILAILDRFIGNIIGIPFTAVISKNSKDGEIIFKKKFGFIFERYTVLKGNEVIATINRGKRLFTPEIFIKTIYGDFVVKSNLTARTFEIVQNGIIVASIKKVTLSLKDTYEIIDFYLEDTLLLIAITFSLENMFHN